MRIFKRFRFSLASLLLGILALCSGVLLWEKRPAWKIVKSWDHKEHQRLNSPIFQSMEINRHYWSRMAGVEEGKPEELIPVIHCPVSLQSNLEFKGTAGSRLLYYDKSNSRCIIYDAGQQEPLATIDLPVKKTVESAYFCYPRDGTHFVIDFIGKTSQECEMAVVEASTGKIIQQSYFAHKGFGYVMKSHDHFYGLATIEKPTEVWDFSANLPRELPEKLRGMSGKYERMGPQRPWSPWIWLSVVTDKGVETQALWNIDSDFTTGWIEGTCSSVYLDSRWIKSWERDAKRHYEVGGENGLRGIASSASKIVPHRFGFSPDDKYLFGGGEIAGNGSRDTTEILIWDLKSDEEPVRVGQGHAPLYFTVDSLGLITSGAEDRMYYWHLQHPQIWYGVVYTLEFWLTLILLILLLFSIRRDFRALKA